MHLCWYFRKNIFCGKTRSLDRVGAVFRSCELVAKKDIRPYALTYFLSVFSSSVKEIIPF